MNETEIHAQQEMDEEILTYVRAMQHMAPVRALSVYTFLKNSRRRRVTTMRVDDRLAYLDKAGCLDRSCEWADGGELITYTITAKGMDLLDGVIPPLGWKKE